VIGRDGLPALPYPQRLAALQDAGIGLWDVIASAHRHGSLDTAIRDPEAARLAELVAALPNLRAIGFNGGTSARIGRRALGEIVTVALIDLPSSSAAHAGMPFAEKVRRWNALSEFLHN
jgi:hypoxanthine-DNA glycosylase